MRSNCVVERMPNYWSAKRGQVEDVVITKTYLAIRVKTVEQFSKDFHQVQLKTPVDALTKLDFCPYCCYIK